MKIVSLKDEIIIKDTMNVFRLKNKELNYTAITNTKTLFLDKKGTKLKIEYLEVLKIFLSKKENKIIITK